MPSFLPFRALRYAPDIELASVAAPPYDVLSDADVAVLAARDPRNIVHIDVPAALGMSYDDAGHLFRSWIADGTLVRDDTPGFTIYRMTFADESGAPRTTSGVLGALTVHDYDERQVLAHERVTPKASSDRLDLTRSTGANLSPIWGLTPATGLTAALSKPGELVGSVTVGGVTHTVERVTDPVRVDQISTLVGSEPVLIADGHHRYGVAQHYLAERRAAGNVDGSDTTLVFVNELVADQLGVAAIHRLYSGIELTDLRSALARCFDITPGPPLREEVLSTMAERGSLLLVTPTGATEWLTPRDEAFDGVRDLDGARLEHALAGQRPTVTYQHGVDKLTRALSEGGLTAGVLIRPTSVAEILITAREGLLMPPKSTFFSPKLLTGLVVREIA